MSIKIIQERLDGYEAKNDVQRFLKPNELKSLELWTEDFFLTKLDNLE